MATRTWRIIEASAIVLFTMQAIRVLFSMLFAQLYDATFEGRLSPALLVAGALLILMLLAPLFSPRSPARLAPGLRAAAIACALARLPLSVDNPTLRLMASILVVGLASFYLAGLIRLQAPLLIYALSLGVLADQALRALEFTYDPSLRLWWLPIQALLVAGMIYGNFRRRAGEEEPAQPAGFWAGISYGAALFLLSSLMALPNAAARWTHGSYPLMVVCLLGASLLPLWRPVRERVIAGWLADTRRTRAVVALLVLLGLAAADRIQGGLDAVALLGAVAFFWLLLPLSLRVGARGARWGLVIGMTLFLLLAISHALAFTYAYTLDLFRGAGLPTFLVAAALAVGPALAYQPGRWPVVEPAGRFSWRWAAGPATLVVVLGALAWPKAPRLLPTTDVVRLGTYNIHYGYNERWNFFLEEEARTIAESGADVIALQEVDTGRLTSLGVDLALWLSHRLGMQVVYLPTIEHTTGIAVLSRLRIESTEARLLPSTAEPTGIIRAVVDVGGQPLAAHATWLGLTPTERDSQIAASLAFIGEGRATLAGDLNSTPDEPVYRALVGQGFLDPFVAGGFVAGPTCPAEDPQERIDYVWIRGLQPTGARVLDSLASDHRMVVVEAR